MSSHSREEEDDLDLGQQLEAYQSELNSSNEQVLLDFESEVQRYRKQVLDSHVDKMKKEKREHPDRHEPVYYQSKLRRVMKDLDAEYAQQKEKLQTKLQATTRKKIGAFCEAELSKSQGGNDTTQDGTTIGDSKRQQQQQQLSMTDRDLQRVGLYEEHKQVFGGKQEPSTSHKARSLLTKGLDIVRNMIAAMDNGKVELRMLEQALEKVLQDTPSASGSARGSLNTSSTSSGRRGSRTRTPPARVSSSAYSSSSNPTSGRGSKASSKPKRAKSPSATSRTSSRTGRASASRGSSKSRTSSTSSKGQKKEVSFLDVGDKDLRQLKRDFLFYDKVSQSKTASRRTRPKSSSRSSLSHSMSSSSRRPKKPVSMVASSRARRPSSRLSTSTSKNSRLSGSRSASRKSTSPSKTASNIDLDNVSLADLMGELNSLVNTYDN
jgi:hypothetical protein